MSNCLRQLFRATFSGDLRSHTGWIITDAANEDYLSQSEHAEQLLKVESRAFYRNFNMLIPIGVEIIGKYDDDYDFSVTDLIRHLSLVASLSYVNI